MKTQTPSPLANEPLHIQTPLSTSYLLRKKINKKILFKLECLQPSGSFKLRGIGALCQEKWQGGAQSFVASSGGNAGIAAAYCGMKLNVSTTVFIPASSHASYIDALKLFGAQVIVAGAVWDEAHKAALEFAENHQGAYIPPFNHPTIWQGNATIIPEVIQQGMDKPDAVVLSVGGGGLACGILQGMHSHGWHDVPLVAVETKGADSFAQCVKAGSVVELAQITSKATSLGAKKITSKLWEWTQKHDIKSVVVEDAVAQQASLDFARDQRLLVELSSGASLSLAYNNHPVLAQARSILVIVCGGINISHFKL